MQEKKLIRKPIYSLGESLRYYRKTLGVSSKDLADKLHVSPSLVYKWEENERIPHETIEELCKYLHIQKEDLFYDENVILKMITKKLTYGRIRHPGAFYFGMASLSLFVIAATMIIVSTLFVEEGKELVNNISTSGLSNLDILKYGFINIGYMLFFISAFLMLLAIVIEIRRVIKRKKDINGGKKNSE